MITRRRITGMAGGWLLLLSLLLFLSSCTRCDCACDCLSEFIKDNPDADNGGTFGCVGACKEAGDTAGCRDVLQGRVTEEYADDVLLACGSECHEDHAEEE